MHTINGVMRKAFGKGVKDVLSEGFIPAEIYGKGVENMHIQVPTRDFERLFSTVGQSAVITVVVDGKEHSVLIHDVQMDLLGKKIVHADLYQVRMDQKIKAEVPIHFIGESLAVKEKDGVLVKALEEIEVEALPKDLPQSLEVDVSVLVDIHQSIHLKDVRVPSGVKIHGDGETVVATVTEQVVEVEETPVVQPVVEGEESSPEKASADSEKKEEK